MTDAPYPIIDPDTGEVLATGDEDRREVAELLAAQLIPVEAAVARRAELRRKLALVLRRDDPPITDDGWTVYVAPAPTPPRAVDRQAVEAHAEALKPIGLAPEPQPPKPQPDKVPGVAAFTSKQARQDLARLGLTPETFVKPGEPGADRIEVLAPARDTAALPV
jgi:hypothetical protein